MDRHSWEWLSFEHMKREACIVGHILYMSIDDLAFWPFDLEMILSGTRVVNESVYKWFELFETSFMNV